MTDTTASTAGAGTADDKAAQPAGAAAPEAKVAADAPVAPNTATDLEDAILTRARQMRLAGSTS